MKLIITNVEYLEQSDQTRVVECEGDFSCRDLAQTVAPDVQSWDMVPEEVEAMVSIFFILLHLLLTAKTELENFENY